jgi:hypothetical protein
VPNDKLSIPSMPDAITADWLTAAMRGSGALKSAQVVSVNVRPVAVGSGFVGQSARLHIAYDRKEVGAPSIVFAKLSSADAAIREQLRAIGLFEVEAGFYRDLAANTLPVRVPRPYLSLYDDAAAASILLIEDLGEARFGDDAAGLSRTDAHTAVRQLALLHAHFWESPALKSLPWLRCLADDAGARMALYRAMLPRFEQRQAEFVSPSLMQAARAYGEILPAYIEEYSAGPHTLTHGDFRGDNFAYTNGSEEGGFVLFDWQSLRRSSGARDLAYMLACSLDVELRRDIEKSLLQLYHETLVASGVNGYSSQDLARDFRAGLGSFVGTAVPTGGMLDFTSERATRLARNGLQRLGAILEDHEFAEYLEDLRGKLPPR